MPLGTVGWKSTVSLSTRHLLVRFKYTANFPQRTWSRNFEKQIIFRVSVVAHVYGLGEGRVRKVPAPDPDNLGLAVKLIRFS